MLGWIAGRWNEHRSLLLFVFLVLAFRSSFADWNEVPTGSMKPTILEGDRIFVNKMAYDLRIPFTHISLLKLADPARGDIIVFDSEASGKKLVKRVVAVPGDVAEMRNNVLYINGERVASREVGSTTYTSGRIENLLGVEHRIRVNKLGSPLSSFGPVTVPEDGYLALGDNRDNSADSRVIGFVPREEIVGRSRRVVLSLDYDDNYLPRSGRFLQPL